MAAQKSKVIIGGKPVDLDRVEELAQVQAQLVPENWKGSKREGVRLFLALQDMAALEFRRHFAHNFKTIVKTALEEKDDNNAPRVAVAFNIEVDLTAPNVAALAKIKMSYSRKFSTEGKPKTHDINQGDFLDEGLNVVLNQQSLSDEMAPAPEPEKPKKEAKADVKKAGDKGKVVQLPKPGAKDDAGKK
jgi:hypothetical protein